MRDFDDFLGFLIPLGVCVFLAFWVGMSVQAARDREVLIKLEQEAVALGFGIFSTDGNRIEFNWNKQEVQSE